jgi:hypothetical protein
VGIANTRSLRALAGPKVSLKDLARHKASRNDRTARARLLGIDGRPLGAWDPGRGGISGPERRLAGLAYPRKQSVPGATSPHPALGLVSTYVEGWCSCRQAITG